MSEINFEYFDPEVELCTFDDQGRPIRPRKKPGRKPNPPSPAQRKAQNRAAQRAFRERKRREMRDTETNIKKCLQQRDQALRKVNSLQRTVKQLRYENNYLKGSLLTLKLACFSHGINVPKFWNTGATDDVGADILSSSKTEGIPQCLEFFLDNKMHIISKSPEFIPTNDTTSTQSQPSTSTSTPAPASSTTGFTAAASSASSYPTSDTSSGMYGYQSTDPSFLLAPNLPSQTNTYPASQAMNDQSYQQQQALALLSDPQFLSRLGPSMYSPALMPDFATSNLPTTQQYQPQQQSHPPQLSSTTTTTTTNTNDILALLDSSPKVSTNYWPPATPSPITTHSYLTPQNHIPTTTTSSSPSSSSIPGSASSSSSTSSTTFVSDPTKRIYPAMAANDAINYLRLKNRGRPFARSVFTPTDLQLAIPHDARIDSVPGPLMRDHMILFQGFYDANALFSFLIKQSVFLGGELGNPDCWFVPPSFFQTYWFLMPNHRPRRIDNAIEMAVAQGRTLSRMMFQRKKMYLQREKFADYFPPIRLIRNNHNHNKDDDGDDDDDDDAMDKNGNDDEGEDGKSMHSSERCDLSEGDPWDTTLTDDGGRSHRDDVPYG
ncbi:hypothetical protein BCR42DRAFT_422284 [Absidia repens]|uniref:BZIP domain-containing protein n=1 Tax=Absidia repens TaxID=90262 RepID=A0A1X2I6B6_9FUNG|nr:hypothetical protein BCR42DRAFT_422284 [Absidia repens]